MKIKVDDKDYTVIKMFTVLHKGWELDNKGWVVEDTEGKRRVVLTSHNMPYIAKLSELKQIIKEHQTVLTGLHEVLKLLEPIKQSMNSNPFGLGMDE